MYLKLKFDVADDPHAIEPRSLRVRFQGWVSPKMFKVGDTVQYDVLMSSGAREPVFAIAERGDTLLYDKFHDEFGKSVYPGDIIVWKQTGIDP